MIVVRELYVEISVVGRVRFSVLVRRYVHSVKSHMQGGGDVDCGVRDVELEVLRLEAHVLDEVLELGHRHLDGVLRGRRAEDRLGVVRDDVGQSTRGSIPKAQEGYRKAV